MALVTAACAQRTNTVPRRVFPPPTAAVPPRPRASAPPFPEAAARSGRASLLARAVLRQLFRVEHPSLVTEAFGVRFPNPVGLAAGYDKDGVALRGLAALGFGHVEIGTVTLRPQPGNPTAAHPPLSRTSALWSTAWAFPNLGARSDAHRAPARFDVGQPQGPHRDQPRKGPRHAPRGCGRGVLQDVGARSRAARTTSRALNVSSPNTPGLRRLQDKSFLEQLLGAVCERRELPAEARARAGQDRTRSRARADRRRARGDRAARASTASSRPTRRSTAQDCPARPSTCRGAPAARRCAGPRPRSCATHRRRAPKADCPIIGVGGIATAEDAIEKLQAGAHLVQVYTGLIYEGPAIARRINRGLIQFCEREGLRSLAELPRLDS